MARGGKRPGAGRPKGRKNTATAAQCATLEELARAHTQTALEALVKVATGGESESARVSAATAILDRGYGRPKQALEHSGKDGAAMPFAVSVTIGSEPPSASETG
jgi:hypothetical protein